MKANMFSNEYCKDTCGTLRQQTLRKKHFFFKIFCYIVIDKTILLNHVLKRHSLG